MKKFMKWMPISMMILGSMFMFAACSDDNEPTTPEEPEQKLPEQRSAFSWVMKVLR